MKKIKAVLLSVVLASGMSSSAQLLDMAVPDMPFGVGVRAGVNNSSFSNNFTYAIDHCDWADTEWATGFTAGTVVDLRIRNFIALQPGFFFESRNMNYRNGYTASSVAGGTQWMRNEEGSVRSYSVNVPVLVSLRLNLSSLLQLQAEFGPYFQWGLDGEDKRTVTELVAGDYSAPSTSKYDLYGDDGYLRSFDWGFKMGVGAVFAKRYYLGIHYMAGCRNVYEQPAEVRHDLSGKNKAWNITLGYTLF